MSNDKQTTAVQTLANFLNEHCNPSVCDINYADFKLAIAEALKIERQQIEDAHGKGNILGFYNYHNKPDIEFEKHASQYFDETFTQ